MKNIKFKTEQSIPANSKSKPTVFNDKYDRSGLLRILLFIAGTIIIAKLFYVQIIRHDYYNTKALAEHVKKYDVSAKRGIIYASDGDKTIPVVLNDERFELYADPKNIVDADKAAEQIGSSIGMDKQAIKTLLMQKNRYVVIAKKLPKDQAQKVADLKIKGIGQRKVYVRTYPQGQLAAQVFGFVNDDQKGQYGIEENKDKELAGQIGQMKAVTDIKGVPLALSNDNIQTQPRNGDDITLTIDVGMQKMLEDAIADGVARTQSKYGSAIVIDPKNGEVKAMANYPTYDPSQYDKVKDSNIFNNKAVTGAWEPGSVMKPLTMSAAFNEGTLNKNSSYYDSGLVEVDDRKITNSISWGARTMTMQDIISKSLNTGAVYMLKSLGGGGLNEQSRTTFYKYLTDKYRFGKPTNIEQSGENIGSVGGPNDGYGLNVRYSNMSFGQGVTITPIQLVAAYSALVNGGTYYQPSLIKDTKTGIFKPIEVEKNVISPQVSEDVKSLMQGGLEANNKPAVRAGYRLGAKSGTAQIADNTGNYREDAYNGTYIGYIEGQKLEYVVMVRLDEPKTSGFASSEAAKTWAQISNKLIDNYNISPKK